jgi:hypothetical protein
MIGRLAVQDVRILARSEAIDPFLADVEAAAPLATEDRQPAVFPGSAGRSVPDFQGDPVLLGRSAVVVENLAAGGIVPSQNQTGHRHHE